MYIIQRLRRGHDAVEGWCKHLLWTNDTKAASVKVIQLTAHWNLVNRSGTQAQNDESTNLTGA